MNSRSGFNSDPASIRAPASINDLLLVPPAFVRAQPLFEPGFYTDIYGRSIWLSRNKHSGGTHRLGQPANENLFSFAPA